MPTAVASFSALSIVMPSLVFSIRDIAGGFTLRMDARSACVIPRAFIAIFRLCLKRFIEIDCAIEVAFSQDTVYVMKRPPPGRTHQPHRENRQSETVHWQTGGG